MTINENKKIIPLSGVQAASFAGPTGAAYFFLTPVWDIIPALYAKYFGLELTVIASIMFFSRLFDGVTDPLIGYLSDRQRMSGGSRKTWVVSGGIFLIVFALLLFIPPPSPSPTYFLLCLVGFYLAFTVLEIPQLSWGSEIATGHTSRSMIFSFRTAAIYIGQTSFLMLPLLPLYKTNEYTPTTLEDGAYIGVFVMLSCLGISLCKTPDGCVVSAKKNLSFGKTFFAVFKNKPLTLTFCTILFQSLSIGMWVGLNFIFMDSYLRLGNYIAAIYLAGNIGGIVTVPLWLKLANKCNRSSIWALGMCIFTSTLAGCWFVTPDTHWIWVLMLVGSSQIAFSCLTVVGPALIADAKDYGSLIFRQDIGASAFSLYTIALKMGWGFGAAFSLGIAGLYGVTPSLTTQTETAVRGLKLGFIIIPVLAGIITIVLIKLTPITRLRYEIIRRRLDAKEARTQ